MIDMLRYIRHILQNPINMYVYIYGDVRKYSHHQLSSIIITTIIIKMTPKQMTQRSHLMRRRNQTQRRPQAASFRALTCSLDVTLGGWDSGHW